MIIGGFFDKGEDSVSPEGCLDVIHFTYTYHLCAVNVYSVDSTIFCSTSANEGPDSFFGVLFSKWIYHVFFL